QQGAADTLLLPVRQDVERMDLAVIVGHGLRPGRPTAAEADDRAVIDLGDDYRIDRILALDQLTPGHCLVIDGHLHDHLIGQDAGIGRAPGLHMHTGDAAGIARHGAADAASRTHAASSLTTAAVRSSTATKKPSVSCAAGVNCSDLSAVGEAVPSGMWPIVSAQTSATGSSVNSGWSLVNDVTCAAFSDGNSEQVA